MHEMVSLQCGSYSTWIIIVYTVSISCEKKAMSCQSCCSKFTSGL